MSAAPSIPAHAILGPSCTNDGFSAAHLKAGIDLIFGVGEEHVGMLLLGGLIPSGKILDLGDHTTGSGGVCLENYGVELREGGLGGRSGLSGLRKKAKIRRA